MNIGQLLIIGFDGTEMSPRLASLLTKIQPAGVILFARNITGAEQTHTLLRECQKCVATPLFTCVDLEGGAEDRSRNVIGFGAFCGRGLCYWQPSALSQAWARDWRKLPRAWLQRGFCPGARLGLRGFASGAEFAGGFGRSEAGGHLRARVSARVGRCRGARLRQTFPGLGEGKLDSHHELPVIEKALKKMLVEDLFPYRMLRRQLPFVMVSHAAYPEVTGEQTPASLSKKWITDILRKKIRYSGLIVSDDMEMGAVLEFAPIERTAVQHIRSGGDLALICHKEELIVRAHEALAREAERDGKFARRVRESASRVLAFKKKSFARKSAASSRSPAPTSTRVEKLRRHLWEFSEEIRLATLARADRRRATRRNAHEHDHCRRDERHLGGRNQCGAGAIRLLRQRRGQRPVTTRAHILRLHASCSRGISVPCPGSARNLGHDERGTGPRCGFGAAEFSSRRTVCRGSRENGAQASREA